MKRRMATVVMQDKWKKTPRQRRGVDGTKRTQLPKLLPPFSNLGVAGFSHTRTGRLAIDPEPAPRPPDHPHQHQTEEDHGPLA